MGVYLGENGHIELRRDQTDPTAPALVAEITPEDVNTERRSFSVDEAYLSFIAGDRIEITTVGTDPNDVNTRPDINFIKGWADPSITRYVSVDPVGRLRLYDSFDDAVNDRKEVAVELTTPTESQTIRLEVRVVPRLDAWLKSPASRPRPRAPISTPPFCLSNTWINTKQA